MSLRRLIGGLGCTGPRRPPLLPTAILGLAVTLGIAAGGAAEEPSAARELPYPVLDSFEPAIQEQLGRSRAALDVLVSRGDAPRLELMEAFGEMGELYFVYQLWEPAEVCFQEAAALAPRDFRWPYLLGVLYSREGQMQRAIELLDRASGLRPESVPAQIRLGRLHFEVGALEEAEAHFARALEMDPDSAAAHHGLGRIAQQRGDPEGAIRYYEKALELQPGATSIHRQLGMAYRDKGDLERARHHVQLNRHDPVSFSDPFLFSLSSLIEGGRVYLRMGHDLLEEGNLAGAVAAFREAVERDPEEKLAHYNLAAVLIRLGEPDEALQHLRRAVEIDPDYRDAQFNLGRLLAESGRFEEAATHFRRAWESDSREREARLEWAVALSLGGRAEAVIAELENRSPEESLGPWDRLGLAVAYRQIGRAEEARRSLEQVIEWEGEERVKARAHLELGFLEEREGLPASALEHFQAAEGLDSELPAAASAAGQMAGRLGRFDESAASFARLIALEPANEGARLGRAMALLLAESFEEARRALESALSELPDSLALRQLLARLLAAAPDAAVRDAARALELAERSFEEAGSAEAAETVAMAWAEAGNYGRAVEWQERALGLLDSSADRSRLTRATERLALYRRGEPCRTPWKG